MLPGFLESASRFFDHILMVSCPPSAAPPDEESIEICKRWGVDLRHLTIDDGFGVVRSKCLHMCPTEWVMLADADERFLPVVPVWELNGSGRYPQDASPNISVGIKEPAFPQGDYLRTMVKNAKDAHAIRFIRRHWMDFSYARPAQRWDDHPDHQLRFLRNREYIGFNPNIRMHEQCRDFRTNEDPKFDSAENPYGPYVEHLHVPAKLMEPAQRKRDIQIYDALSVDGHQEKLNELYK